MTIKMRNILFNAYNKSPGFIAEQIQHLEGLPAFPGEEYLKEKTLDDLHFLLRQTLKNDCAKWKVDHDI